MWMQLTRPSGDQEKLQAHFCVRISKSLAEPRRRCRDGDAHFFVQLAHQRIVRGFTRFEFAARKFPITGIGFAGRATGQQESAVRANQNASGDFGDFHGDSITKHAACGRVFGLANCRLT